MGRIRKMPSRNNIFQYWNGKLDTAINDSTCFKCGFDSYVERAHIKSVFDGGSDECDNLHLLCHNCHKTSEGFNGDVYWHWLNYGDHYVTITIIARYYKKCVIEPKEFATIFDNHIKERISTLGVESFEKNIDLFLKEHNYELNELICQQEDRANTIGK